MARAKRTDRAEARRRHREALAAAAVSGEEAPNGTAALEGDVVASPGRPKQAAAAKPAGGQGLAYAFRASFRPLDLRGDLEYLPTLLRTRAIVIPVALQALAVVLVLTTGLNFVSVFAFQYFIIAPPVGANFIAGFLAPKASWLAGWITGLVGVVGLAVVVLSPAAGELGAGDVSTEALLLQGLLIAPAAGAIFAAAAAWYKRFLNLASPARQAARAGTAKRSSQRRR